MKLQAERRAEQRHLLKPGRPHTQNPHPPDQRRAAGHPDAGDEHALRGHGDQVFLDSPLLHLLCGADLPALVRRQLHHGVSARPPLVGAIGRLAASLSLCPPARTGGGECCFSLLLLVVFILPAVLFGAIISAMSSPLSLLYTRNSQPLIRKNTLLGGEETQNIRFIMRVN